MLLIQELSDGNYYIHISVISEGVRINFQGNFQMVESEAGPKEGGFYLKSEQQQEDK